VLDQLGPAINARHSLFLYGPPGNGKSVMALAMGSLMRGGLEIPHALAVEGSIIRVFDPLLHDPMSDPPPAQDSDDGLDQGPTHDDRWVRCRRPVVTVGGELELENLDLVHNQGLGFYRAPIQTKANGGLLVIDDFGRQRCSPQALLNRWIVPLETRQDYLTLRTGQKISIPFSVFVVFATNIKPADLVDEAFLRRIRYKVFAQSPTIDEYLQIFENCCLERGIPFERKVVEDLLERFYRPQQIPLRGCHPRDLLEHVISLADYSGRPRVLTAELLDEACSGYFVDDREPTPGQTIWNVLPPA
jgi:SpoVK/Ycf46/Vps4 family AAA+-type ATPase